MAKGIVADVSVTYEGNTTLVHDWLIDDNSRSCRSVTFSSACAKVDTRRTRSGSHAERLKQ